MIDSGASVHVCPPKHGQGDGFRKSSETRPLLTASGAEMQQRAALKGHNSPSCVGHETTNLVAGVHDGLLQCVLHEGPMLDRQKQRERI